MIRFKMHSLYSFVKLSLSTLNSREMIILEKIIFYENAYRILSHALSALMDIFFIRYH